MVDNLTIKYHQRSKETVDKKVTKSIKKFFNKKKEKKWLYGREGYKNIPEDEKQKLVQIVLKGGKTLHYNWGIYIFHYFYLLYKHMRLLLNAASKIS